MPTDLIHGDKPPLEGDKFYSLSEEELAFFKSQTGIINDDALKQHILDVQAKAYDVYGYPCIRRFAFTKLKISRLPAYKHVLELGQRRKNAILLDIGCCFGNDARKVIADGYPAHNVIASDLRRDFWDLGHELFKSSPETFPVPFVAGDAFDPAVIAPRPPFYEAPETPLPDLNTLTSLTPLQGHVSAIHASAFFHLFPEEQQLQLAHQLASLLSPLPGSTIFGSHGGRKEKGFRIEGVNNAGGVMFCHSPDTWKEMWGKVFKAGTIRAETELVQFSRPDLDATPGAEFFVIRWSVVRL